jgi:hypothetical protein
MQWLHKITCNHQHRTLLDLYLVKNFSLWLMASTATISPDDNLASNWVSQSPFVHIFIKLCFVIMLLYWSITKKAQWYTLLRCARELMHLPFKVGKYSGEVLLLKLVLRTSVLSVYLASAQREPSVKCSQFN